MPKMPHKKSRNGAMNCIILPTLQKKQPHAAYSTFTHGILGQYTYFLKTIPGMHEFTKPADDVIRLELLPTLLNFVIAEVDR